MRTHLIGIAGVMLASAGTVGAFFVAWTIVPHQDQHAAIRPAISTAALPEARSQSESKKPVENSTLSLSSVQDLAAALRTIRAGSSGGMGHVPTFDVARVDPAGDAVIAGRAAPGASVELLLAGKVHHTAVADASGEFVMIPEPLPPGEYELSLRGRQSDGTTSMSEKSIAVAVGARNAPRTQLATAPKVVEPAPAFAAQVPILPASTVAVEAEGGGKLRAHGSFPVGAAVRLYINDAYVASATASQDGVVVFAIESGMVAGKYRARFEQFNFATGRIEARAEVTFTAEGPTSSPAATTTSVISPAVPQRSGGEFTTEVDAFQTTGSLARSPEGTTTVHQVAGAKNASAETPSLARKSLAASVPSNDAHIVLVPRIETAIVVQGDNLWHISRSAYGRGVQYPEIYEANRDQIRDPKLIYPGQVFVLPRTLLVE